MSVELNTEEHWEALGQDMCELVNVHKENTVDFLHIHIHQSITACQEQAG